jgi:hypothetical protein
LGALARSRNQETARDVHHRGHHRTRMSCLSRQTGNFWLPKRNSSERSIRTGGTATLTIDYGAYSCVAARFCCAFGSVMRGRAEQFRPSHRPRASTRTVMIEAIKQFTDLSGGGRPSGGQRWSQRALWQPLGLRGGLLRVWQAP